MSNHLSLLQQQREIIYEYHQIIFNYNQSLNSAKEQLKREQEVADSELTSSHSKANEVNAQIVSLVVEAMAHNIRDGEISARKAMADADFPPSIYESVNLEAEMKTTISPLSTALEDVKSAKKSSVLMKWIVIYGFIGACLIVFISGLADRQNPGHWINNYYSITYISKDYQSEVQLLEDLIREGNELKNRIIFYSIVIIAVMLFPYGLITALIFTRRKWRSNFVWFVLYGLIIVGVSVIVINQTSSEANLFISNSTLQDPSSRNSIYPGYLYLFTGMKNTTNTYRPDVYFALERYANRVIYPAKDLFIGGILIVLVLDFLRVQFRRTKRVKENFTKKLARARLSTRRFIDQANISHAQLHENANVKYQSNYQSAEVRYKWQLSQLKIKTTQYSQAVHGITPDWKTRTFPIGNPYITLFGQFNLDRLPYERVPVILPIIGGRSIFFSQNDDRKLQVIQGVQAALLNIMMCISPGKLRFTFIDPVGLGQNVAPLMHLADYDEVLVTGKAWTQQQHIEQRLVDLTEHMENVIQKYLRNEYPSIEAYNAQAGEVAEPYRLVVVFDFPVNFSDVTARRLVSIAQNGPRCGVYAIIIANTKQPMPYGFNLSELEQVCTVIGNSDQGLVWQDPDFKHFSFQPTLPPDDKTFNDIVRSVGEKAKDANKVEVPFERMVAAEQNWWERNSQSGLIVALGPTGARKFQQLELGKGTAHHVLVAGKTGSGKSNLLHTIIIGLALNYSPEEIELYLIDFKKGVEFKAYASYLLPHARVIAIESEREFGLSVLQGLDNELKRRGDLFRNNSVDSLGDYRQKSGEKIPRILLLVDEFQEFFTEDDSVTSQTSQILDRLVRQGRSFGIHILLGSQTLAGAYTLAKSTMEQMAVRIALQCSEADSRLILADDNPGARLLTRPGEAIYNATNGLVEGNNRFQTAFLPDEQRDNYLSQLRDRAQKTDYKRIPVVFEGNTLAEVKNNQQLQNLLNLPAPINTPRAILAWVGEPVALRESIAARFRRQSGSNLLIVGRDEEAALGMTAIALISMASHMPISEESQPHIYVLDFSSADTPYADFFTDLESYIPKSIKLGRRRQLTDILVELTAEVQNRLATNIIGATSKFLIIYGLQRARDLRPVDEFNYSYNGNEAAEPNPAELLNTLLKDGPEVGIHILLWCDTVTNLNRSIDRRFLREFAVRVVLQMSAEDSSTLIDNGAASKLGTNRALLYDEDDGRLEKFRPYRLPTEDWLKQIGERMQTRL